MLRCSMTPSRLDLVDAYALLIASWLINRLVCLVHAYVQIGLYALFCRLNPASGLLDWSLISQPSWWHGSLCTGSRCRGRWPQLETKLTGADSSAGATGFNSEAGILIAIGVRAPPQR